MIRVLVVDDHDLVRIGICRLLADAKGIQVINSLSSGEEAVSYCRQHQPDIILMDLHMPGIGGFEAFLKIKRTNPACKVIMLSAHIEQPFPAKLMQAGAMGYLTKNTSLEEMLIALQKVHSGQRYLSADIAQTLAITPFTENNSSPFEQLSKRELQITFMITQGQKVADIANSLNLSPKTVNSYRYRLFSKLGIAGDVELTHLAIRYQLTDQHNP